jgi:hypothetical protein
LDRSIVTTLMGQPIRIVAPEDSNLLTAYHAVREHLAPQSAVKDLCDLKMWFEVEAAEWDREITIQRTVRCGLARTLLAAWRILADLDGGSGAGGAAHQLAGELGDADRSTADRLVDLFHLQLRQGAASEAMLGLSAVTPALLKRFVVSRFRSLTSPDYEAHKFRHHPEVSRWQKFKRLAHELICLRPGRWATYRAMAMENRRLIASDRGGGIGPESRR